MLIESRCKNRRYGKPGVEEWGWLLIDWEMVGMIERHSFHISKNI